MTATTGIVTARRLAPQVDVLAGRSHTDYEHLAQVQRARAAEPVPPPTFAPHPYEETPHGNRWYVALLLVGVVALIVVGLGAAL